MSVLQEHRCQHIGSDHGQEIVQLPSGTCADFPRRADSDGRSHVIRETIHPETMMMASRARCPIGLPCSTW